jgi:hypothetical protein
MVSRLCTGSTDFPQCSSLDLEKDTALNYNLDLLAMALAVLIEGAGAFSIDRLLVR